MLFRSAKYFENHKHDLPRSHEVCIKRFQSNAEGIQQLDRKYGNLVSMIQGLGQKHQEFLPPEPEEDEVEEAPGTEVKTEKRVHNWVEAVTASLQQLTPEDDEFPENVPDDGRTTHFDRPMKEIRVGESPSRPWGISIPVKYTDDAQSSSSVGSAPTASPQLPLETSRPVGETPQKASKCPFDHRALGKAPEAKELANVDAPETPIRPPRPVSPEPSHPRPKTAPCEPPHAAEGKTEDGAAPQSVPPMVFNGPVFIGYSADQLAVLLQNSNFGSTMR